MRHAAKKNLAVSETSRQKKRGRPAGYGSLVAETKPATQARPVLLLIPVLISFITFLVFFPALQNGFVNWDDGKNLLENTNYRGLGWSQLRWMFTTFHEGHYQPLAWMTFGLDYLVWGMEPFGYHLTSLLLHAGNAVLFYFLALKLLVIVASTEDTRLLSIHIAAGFAALLFAIHPLRVESVAWATERRDVLSGLFLLSSVLCYLRAVVRSQSVRAHWMVAAVFFYGLSLLSKAIGMTLPMVLLVLDVYPLNRVRDLAGKRLGPNIREVFFEKLPFVCFAISTAAIAPLAQGEAMRSVDTYGLGPRLSQALFGLAFYLWKTVVPTELSPLYELPYDFNPFDWRFLLSGLVVVALSTVLFVARRRWPAGIASWLCYVIIVAPVLGLAQSGPQIVADRYSYLSCLGWAILAAAGLCRLWQVRSIGAFNIRPAITSIALAVVVVLGTLTWRQTQIWHDSETLWRHVLALDEKSSFAHNNLALALGDRGELAEAINHFRRAVKINPAFVEAHTNLGHFLALQGSPREAIPHLRRALQVNPEFANAHNTLGNILAERGQSDEAIEHFRMALKKSPASAMVHYNFARVLAKRGDLEEAITHYRRALDINPSDPDIHNNLGLALASEGSLDRATEQFRAALRVDPSYAKAYFNLGKVSMQQDRFADAVVYFQQALRIQPAVAEIHENLARALLQQGRKEEALQHYHEALSLLKSRSNDDAVR
jgi:tetratricopeptide (TPR) repeat protein